MGGGGLILDGAFRIRKHPKHPERLFASNDRKATHSGHPEQKGAKAELGAAHGDLWWAIYLGYREDHSFDGTSPEYYCEILG